MSIGGVGGRGDGFAPRRSERLRNKEPHVTKKVASKKRVERSEPSRAQPLAGRVEPLAEERAAPQKVARVGRKGRNQPEQAGRPPLLVQWVRNAKTAAIQAVEYVYQRTPHIPIPMSIQTTAILGGSILAMHKGHIKPIGLMEIAGVEVLRILAARHLQKQAEAKNANK